MKSIPYGKQSINQEDIDAVIDVMHSDFLTQGPKIDEFEDKFAKYIGSKYAVAVINGTAALHLCNLALGVKPGDKVITTPITFAATANSVLFCGGEIDFVDIDKKTYLIDLDKLEQKLTNAPENTYKGIIPVDFAGYPVNTEHLRDIANKYNLWIIEDACHAPGGYFIDSQEERQYCGNGKYADLSIFSFHPVKHIATGEGGMITTNNKKLYEKLLLLRNHGITKSPELLHENHGGWYYEMQTLGYNYRMPDILAALGISQLKRAEQGLESRREIANRYNEAFKNTSVITPFVDDNFAHAFHLYVIMIDDRKGLYEHLRQNNIYAQVHYIPIHLQPYYKQFGWKRGDFPIVEDYYDHCLSLPIFPSLTHEEQEYIISKVLTFTKSLS